MSRFVGIVKDKKFQPFHIDFDPGSSVRLTRIRATAAAKPADGEINLTKYEGYAIMVNGIRSSGKWITEAEVLEQAGPLFTELIQSLLSQVTERTEGASSEY